MDVTFLRPFFELVAKFCGVSLELLRILVEFKGVECVVMHRQQDCPGLHSFDRHKELFHEVGLLTWSQGFSYPAYADVSGVFEIKQAVLPCFRCRLICCSYFLMIIIVLTNFAQSSI